MVDEIVEDFLPDDSEETAAAVAPLADRIAKLKAKVKAKLKATQSKAAPTSKEFKAKIVRKVRQSKASSAPASIVGVGKPEMCQDGCGKPCKPGRAFLPGHFPKLLAWLKKTVEGHRPEGASNAYYHRVTTPAEARKMLAQFHISKAGQGQKAKAKAKANPTTAITQPKAARRKRRTKAEMEAARTATPGVPAHAALLAEVDRRPMEAMTFDPAAEVRKALQGVDISTNSPAYWYLRGVLGI